MIVTTISSVIKTGLSILCFTCGDIAGHPAKLINLRTYTTMELVKANNQGELLALEIGIHALATVNDKTKKGGGVRAYAAEIGKGEDALKQWIGGADVYGTLCDISRTNELHNKTSHLYEISKAPQHTWQLLADLLIKCDWSVKDTQAAVNRVKSINLLDWMKADFKEIATTPAIVLSLSM